MKNLRELAKAYAQNVIDQETYRKSRRELIKSICAGETDAKKHEYLAPLQTMPDELMDDTTENMITQISSSGGKAPATTASNIDDSSRTQRNKAKPRRTPGKKTKPKSAPPPVYISPGILDRRNIVFGIGTVIVLCIVTLTILLLPNTEDKPPANDPVQIAEPSAGQLLITDFIAQKNWTQNSLAVFVASWQQLSNQEQTIASASPEMKRLINTVYQQLEAERALLSLGEVENAISNQRSLVNFAEQLGIDDDRLTVYEPAGKTETETDKPDLTQTLSPAEIINETDSSTIAKSESEEPETDNSSLQSELLVNNVANNVVAQDTEQAVTETAMESIANTSDEDQPAPNVITETIDSAAEPVQQKIDTAQTETKAITQKTASRAECNTSLVKSRKPFCRDKIDGVGYGPTMVVIPGGKFTMGGKLKDEQPAHSVSINAAFAMSVHEISFAEYDKYCQSTKQTCPKQPWSGKDYPVVNVTHADATSYADWLSQKTGQTYRLPSEAEWEYAARAGTKTEYPFGDEILITNAVFSDVRELSAPLTTSDRSINRNKFRLYHMVGNVREWVADTWHAGYSGAPDNGSARIEKGQNLFVVRGGSYADSAEALRSGARNSLSTADSYTGFRVLQELSE